MTTLYPDPDIVPKAIARLTDLYRTKPHARALTETLAERFTTEDAIDYELYRAQWIDTATGLLLNAVGELVGEPRLGRSDDLYRLWIQARVRINRTQGTIADSYHLIRLIAGNAPTVRYYALYPAAYLIEVSGTTVDSLEMYKLLDAVRPAGVGMSLIVSSDLSNIFTFNTSNTESITDTAKGFADPAQTTGGKFQGIL